MLRWLYIRLLWRHPAQFRYRFGDDMLEAFDLTGGTAERLGLLGDAFVSIFRQWILRPEFHEPWQASTAEGSSYQLLRFEQIAPYKPRGIALAQGALMAIVLIAGVVNAINYGGGKIRHLLIGMHRPGFGLIKVSRESMEVEKLNTTVENGKDADDPWRPFAISYLRVMPVLMTLDDDRDLAISAAEIMKAPVVLLSLDRDHDGKLSAEECGYLPPAGEPLPPENLAKERLAFMLANPVLNVLDADHDGEISAAEIANSSMALRPLDILHDERLVPYEYLPLHAVSQAASMITRFDTNDDGVLSLGEFTKDDPDAMRQLAATADRNRDGLTTRGELIVELAMRPDVTQPPRAFRQSAR